jgi:hypothetical protein
MTNYKKKLKWLHEVCRLNDKTYKKIYNKQCTEKLEQQKNLNSKQKIKDETLRDVQRLAL